MEKNKFFDINHLPQEEGIIVWPISMSRIGNEQSPKNCFKFLQELDKKIKKTKGIGIELLYGDYLYFHSDEPASILRNRYLKLMFSHKNGLLKILEKHPEWITKAFSFTTFGQAMLDNAAIFEKSFDRVAIFAKSDPQFLKYLEEDCKRSEHGLKDKEKNFILEEITLFYLAAKGKISFNNRFVSGTEKWVLQMYPGKPLKSEVYLFQTNPLKLHNPGNKYENGYYDLENKVYYDYSKIDLKTFDFSE